MGTKFCWLFYDPVNILVPSSAGILAVLPEVPLCGAAFPIGKCIISITFQLIIDYLNIRRHVN
jgi:hypothetical protein